MRFVRFENPFKKLIPIRNFLYAFLSQIAKESRHVNNDSFTEDFGVHCQLE